MSTANQLMPRPLPAASPSAMLTPPIKWHGGKHYLAAQIIRMMPPHKSYVEPFFGGGAVLLAKNPVGVSEVANDLDGRLTNFWEVLREPAPFAEFLRLAEATPFAKPAFDEAEISLCDPNPVRRAWAFFVRCRQSLAGRMQSFAPLSRTRTRRGMNEQASAWNNAVEGLPAVHERLRRVVVLKEPAVDVIRRLDDPGTLFYCDPPYMASTRTAPETYAVEMDEAGHRELLDALLACRGRVILSGYDCDLYQDRLARWTRHDFELPNNAAGGKRKRRMVESVWTNFPVQSGVDAGSNGLPVVESSAESETLMMGGDS